MKPYFLKMVAPVPKIMSHKRALFIGPHPDDIEIGAGSTVSKLVKAGIEVSFIIVTDGGSGSSDVNLLIDDLVRSRRLEAINSAQSLGVTNIYFLNFPDGAKYDEWDVSIKLAEYLVKLNPDIVFCPDPELPSEIHPDHIKTGNATKTAILMSFSHLAMRRNMIFVDTTISLGLNKTLAYYYTHRPNQFVPVSKTDIALSYAAVLKHQTQFQDKTQAWGMLKMYLDYRRRRFGNPIHPRQDGYFVMGSVHQHCFPEINNY